MATKFQKSVIAAVTAYAKGSAKLVRLFEEAATHYWSEEGKRNAADLVFFLNALKDFPVLQKSAFETVKTFGKFEATLDNGVVNLVNKKVSDVQRAKYIETVNDYKAQAYNSLLSANQKKLMEAFDLKKRMTGFENSATALVVNALANDASLTQAQMIAQLQAVITAIGGKDLSEKVNDKRVEIELEKAELPEVANEAAAESENAA